MPVAVPPRGARATDVPMDIEINGDPAGRLSHDAPRPVPRTVENFVRLCKGSDVGIDPKLTYAGRVRALIGKYTYTCKGNGKQCLRRGEVWSATR